jgi:hypothetical protein
MAFPILSGRGWKTWLTASNSCSLTQVGIQTLASIYAKTVEKKHHITFVKVVEGSEIFPIHHFMHFYSKFWSFTCSNSDTWKRF